MEEDEEREREREAPSSCQKFGHFWQRKAEWFFLLQLPFKGCYLPNVAFLRHDDVQIIANTTAVDVVFAVDTWLTEFRIDQIRVVLQKGYVLYV